MDKIKPKKKMTMGKMMKGGVAKKKMMGGGMSKKKMMGGGMSKKPMYMKGGVAEAARVAAHHAVLVVVHAVRVEAHGDGPVLEQRDREQLLVLGAHRDDLPAADVRDARLGPPQRVVERARVAHGRAVVHRLLAA